MIFTLNAKVSTCFDDVSPGVYGYYCQPYRAAGEQGKIIVQWLAVTQDN